MMTTEVRVATEFEEAEKRFRRSWPSFERTALLDRLRSADYGRLDERGEIYLDYTGGGLYASSQVERHLALLRHEVFGNPHSNNPTSLATTAHVEATRARVLDYFHASPDEYLVIFTQNASGALKLVGESYPFSAGTQYLLTFDNHNSVNGIREFARAKGAEVHYVALTPGDLRIDREHLAQRLNAAPHAKEKLFAYPAQSNFSGAQHPLELIEEAHAAGWDVLLDAAAFVPTNRLDLSKWKPDFVTISFYKMFGYPTGVGCLLMKKEKFAKLRRPWFAGGTVQIASVQSGRHYLAKDAAAFEDGTVDYLSIPAVAIGLDHLSTIGIDVIHDRVLALAGWLLESLQSLLHSNGRRVVDIHGPSQPEARGGTISFHFSDVSGVSFDMAKVQELANEAHISLRTGCFCNPGAGEVAFGLTREQIASFFEGEEGMSFEELRGRVRKELGKEIGALRVSVGLVTTFADVYRFVEFARRFIDHTFADIGVGVSPRHALRESS